MSKFKPNKEQDEFIRERGKNILVSASAGSGKTSSMVEKIVSIIDGGVPLEKLLIVTYTVASANEMKQKLYHAITEKMRDCDDEKRAYLLSQLDSLNNCDIGTIHSFCKKVITKYFYVIDQDLNYGILEKSDYLYDKAVNAVFRKYIVSDDQNFFTLYESYNKKRDESLLIGVIKQLNDFFVSKVNASDWKNKVLELCYNPDEKLNICTNYVLDMFKSRAKMIGDIFKKLQNIYVRDKISVCIDSRIALCDNILAVESYTQLLKFEDYDVIKKVPTHRLDASFSDWVNEYEEAMVMFKIFRDDLKKLSDFEFDSDHIVCIKNLLVTLFEVVDKIKLQYDKYKKEKNVLDFADLEHKCFEILSKNADVCKEMQDTYEYIFVDEYQDVNELQEGILNLIKRQNNLNLIGDIKQSIFAFRLATPKLFVEKYNTYPNDPNSRVIMFNENWRSENSILQFVNTVCNKVITKQTIGIDYRADAQLRYPDSKKKGVPSVEIDIINKVSKSKNGEIEDEEDKNYLRKEAQLIAKKITEICNMTYNNGEEDVKYKFSDIAIIVRKKSGLLEEIVNVLKEYNIPCNASFKLNIFSFHSVQILYSILKLLNNSDDDLSCAIVLKSLFGFDENDLVAVKNFDSVSLNKCCDLYVKNANDDDIKLRLSEYYNFLADMRFKMTNMTLCEVMRDVVDKYFSSEMFKKDGVENMSYIDTFLSLIDNKLYAYDIKSCIDYLADLEKNKTDIDFVNSDGVQITTIHSSKGLEYKAVIFAGLGQRLSINLNTSDIVISDKYGVGLQYLDTENRIKQECVVKKACLLANEREEVNEELRLLYVALTRGMKYLVLTGAYPVDDIVGKKNQNIYSCRRYFDWIFMALDWLDRKKFETSKSFTIFDGTDSQARVTVDDFDFEQSQKSEFEFGEYDKNLIGTIKTNLAWEYPYESTQNLAIKNSVSGLLKEESDYEHSVDMFEELTLNERIAPSESVERGNAYHTVMQEIDFSTDCDIEKIIRDKCVEKYVDAKKVKKCVETIRCFTLNATVKKEAQFLMRTRHMDFVKGGSDKKLLVQGVVDLYIDDGDSVTLIDYKTNRVKDIDALAKMYATQMRLYALALQKALAKPVKNVFLYSFDKDKLVDMSPYIKMKN